MVEYGKDIPEIVETMKSIIYRSEENDSLEVVEVNVEVVDIKDT